MPELSEQPEVVSAEVLQMIEDGHLDLYLLRIKTAIHRRLLTPEWGIAIVAGGGRS